MLAFTRKKTAVFVKQPIFWILVGAFLVRLGTAVYLGNDVTGLSGAHDEITYSALGERYANGYGFTFPENWYPWIPADTPQSYFSIPMSFYLGLIYKVFGYQPLIARIITGLMSTMIVGMIYLLARRLFNEKIGLIAAVIAMGYAYFAFYGVALVTETPFTLFILIAIYLSYDIIETPNWQNWTLMGLAIAIAVVLRTTAIFFVPLLVGWLLYRRPQDWYYATIPFILTSLFLLPFIWRNYQLWGQFSLAQTQFGHVFWNGNHPGHEGDFHPFQVFPIPEEVLASGNDVDMTNELLALGIEYVLDNPRDFVSLTLTRLRELFKFWPTADSSTLSNLLRVFSFGLMWPFALAGLILSRHKWQQFVPIWFFMLVHIGIHAVTWTMIRYRVPVDAILVLFAALTLATMWERQTWWTTMRNRQVGI